MSVKIRCPKGHLFIAPLISVARCDCGWRPPPRQPDAGWLPPQKSAPPKAPAQRRVEISRYTRPSEPNDAPSAEILLTAEVHVAKSGIDGRGFRRGFVKSVERAGAEPILDAHIGGRDVRLRFSWGHEVWWQAAEGWIVFADSVALNLGLEAPIRLQGDIEPEARGEDPHYPPSRMNPPSFP